MESKRAREIAASPKMVNVVYNGFPIYIENVTNNNTAMIHTLNNPSNRQMVSVSDLVEQ